MEIVLLERVENLGQMGDVVQVRSGYARNYLLPQGKALRATPANLEHFERERAEIEARSLARKAEAEAVAGKIDGHTVIILRQASEGGSLYGSVTPRDIAESCRENGILVDRRQIALERPLKLLGMHAIRVVLHPDVFATLTVNLARSLDEARLQEQGLTAGDAAAEAARAFDALTEDDDPGAPDPAEGETDASASGTGTGADPAATATA